MEGKSISIEEIILARTQLGKDQFKGHCEGARFTACDTHLYSHHWGGWDRRCLREF